MQSVARDATPNVCEYYRWCRPGRFTAIMIKFAVSAVRLNLAPAAMDLVGDPSAWKDLTCQCSRAFMHADSLSCL